jgi:hypothetical protein
MRTKQKPKHSRSFRAGLLTLAISLGWASALPARAAGNDKRAPEVPPSLAVSDTNKVHVHAYAVGVQIYNWVVNPTNSTLSSWVFVAPEAVLFDLVGEVVGTHYAGPTWESNSGSKVVGVRLNGATVDSTAIPWLLLQAKSTAGKGIFAATTYVQRVNTTGGLPPPAPGTSTGQQARVPYTAEYYFYRHSN